LNISYGKGRGIYIIEDPMSHAYPSLLGSNKSMLFPLGAGDPGEFRGRAGCANVL